MLLASIAGLEEYLGQDNDALTKYVKLIDCGEDSYENLMKTAKLALKNGDNRIAHTYAARAAEKKADDLPALSLAAQTALSLSEWETAATYYRAIAAVDPSSLETIVQLEEIYREHSDREDLVWALECHHKIRTENVEVLGELCELLYSMDNKDRSMYYVNKGLCLNPEDGRFCILLGENYRSLGQTDKAIEQFKLAMEDEEWKSSAQRLIWQIEIPETEEEKVERAFFSRGK